MRTFQILNTMLRSLQFEEAAQMALQLKSGEGDGSDLEEALYYLSEEDRGVGIFAYTLLLRLMQKEDDILWHRVARDIFSNNLCHYPFAYAVSIYHGRKVCELDPTNTAALEILLDIGRNRSDYMSVEESCEIADKILELDPNNIKGSVYSKRQ